MKNPDFSNRLIQAREAKGLTQADMARELKMTQQSYFHYEHGREMKASMIVKVCAILECSPGWLIGHEEEGQHLPPESPLLKRLKEAFNELNNKGQKKVVGYAEDLTGNVEYCITIKKEAQNSEGPTEAVEGVA